VHLLQLVISKNLSKLFKFFEVRWILSQKSCPYQHCWEQNDLKNKQFASSVFASQGTEIGLNLA